MLRPERRHGNESAQRDDAGESALGHDTGNIPEHPFEHAQEAEKGLARSTFFGVRGRMPGSEELVRESGARDPVSPLPTGGYSADMKDLTRKKVYADEATMRNLQNLKTDRKRLGLTQEQISAKLRVSCRTYQNYEYGDSKPRLLVYLMLAEIFSWDIKDNPNYLFYMEFKKEKNGLRYRKEKYGYSNLELSERVMEPVTGETIRHVIKKDKDASVKTYALVMDVFREEKRLEAFRENLMRG